MFLATGLNTLLFAVNQSLLHPEILKYKNAKFLYTSFFYYLIILLQKKSQKVLFRTNTNNNVTPTVKIQILINKAFNANK